MSSVRSVIALTAALALGMAGSGVQAAHAQTTPMSPSVLVQGLKQGGYVVIMRHAASPLTPPSPELANKDNTTRERQLDEAGRRTATAMGEAIKAKGVPVGEVLSSPTYRALETARLAGFTGVKAAPELGEGGANMQAASQAAATWLRKQATISPAPGRNTFLITHFPNIRAAFPDNSNVGDGEALVFKPDGSNEPRLVGRLPITVW
jgi:phosphohistidine phosphatase SixA